MCDISVSVSLLLIPHLSLSLCLMLQPREGTTCYFPDIARSSTPLDLPLCSCCLTCPFLTPACFRVRPTSMGISAPSVPASLLLPARGIHLLLFASPHPLFSTCNAWCLLLCTCVYLLQLGSLSEAAAQPYLPPYPSPHSLCQILAEYGYTQKTKRDKYLW